MTQFGTFAFFLFLIISVSANQIVTKMSLGEYCNFFKNPFCSLTDLKLVAMVVTISGINDKCAGELIKKTKNVYGIEEIIGAFNFEISSTSHTTWNRIYNTNGYETYASQNDPAIFYTCSADVVF